MVRMVVHAGFHKTGTSTIQRILWQNKKLLHPYARIILKPGVAALCDATRLWSRRREAFERRGVEIELDLFLESQNPKAGRTICISAEDLAGHMPWRNGINSYDAAPELMQLFTEATQRAPFKVNDLAFLFTTRSAESWLRSSYVQHVRGDRMVLDYADYATRYEEAADLDAVVENIAQSVAPATVIRSALEDTRDLLFGPATPILDLLEVPESIRSQMEPSKPINTAPPDDVLTEMLHLNRSNMSDSQVALLKQDLLQR